MKKILLFLFFAASSSYLQANRIDKLQTDKDVERFMHKRGKHFRDFYVSDIQLIYFEKEDQQTAVELGVNLWQKADFDRNGLTDLLVIDRDNDIFVVMDNEKGFKIHRINNDVFNYFPVIRNSDKETQLVLFKKTEYDEEPFHKFQDTIHLVYRANNFIESNPKVIQHQIESITFSTTMCLGTCPEFKMEIDSNRNAIYNAIQFNDQKGTFTTKIDMSSYTKIIGMINYIDFAHLKDNYTINWTDHPSCKLTITYDGGKTKTIRDYGEMGTFGLRALYSELFTLRKSQSWKSKTP